MNSEHRAYASFVPRLAALVAIPLITVACASSGSTRAPSASPVANVKDFEIVAYQGETVLGSQRGRFSRVFDQGKPVVLNFWAGLCPPCRAEMPAFQRVAAEFDGQFIMVGVDIGPFIGLGTHDDAQQLLAELQIRYPVAYAVEASPVRLHNVRSMPTTLFFAADGQIVQRQAGIMAESQFRSAVQALIGPA